jgi:hypothetical protein
MTDTNELTGRRLPDDRLQALRLMLHEHAASWLHTIDRDTLAAMLDEIEERRRIDAEISARVDEAWQAGREEEEQKRKDFIAKRNDPELDAYEERASQFWRMDLRGRMKRTEGMPMPEIPGKEGGA